jgi:hypothetical protein
MSNKKIAGSANAPDSQIFIFSVCYSVKGEGLTSVN